MQNIKIRCPCCDNYIVIKIDDAGNVSSVFFDGEKLSENEAFKHYGICLGLKGGENIAG